MRWNEVRGRLYDHADYGEIEFRPIPTADESVCKHAETICDNCVNLGWSDDWYLEFKEWYISESFGLMSRWSPIDEREFPDPRRASA